MNINELNLELQNGGHQWIADDNPISDLDDGVKLRMLGAIKPEGEPTEELSEVELFSSNPPRIDWRYHNGRNFVTSVKDQAKCGSCVAFGSLAAMESRIVIEKNRLLDLSEADAFFCSSHGANCKGWWPYSLFIDNKPRGMVKEKWFPYQSAFRNGQPSCSVVSNRGDKAIVYNNIDAARGHNNAKNYLAQSGPIAACFDVYNDFFHYRSGVYTKSPNAKYSGGHCICIVGYVDDSSITGGGYYICKNSWGTRWGMGGYFNIAYGQCNIDRNAMYSVSNITLPNSIRLESEN